VYDLVKGHHIHAFGNIQNYIRVQSLCILNDTIFLSYISNKHIYQFSLQGEYIISWEIQVKSAYTYNITSWDGFLFIAAGSAGVLMYKADGCLLKQLNTLHGRSICAMSVAVDDENMFIQDEQIVHVCKSNGEYLHNLCPWLSFSKIELTPQFIICIASFVVIILERNNYHCVTRIYSPWKMFFEFCILIDHGCIATKDNDGTINIYGLSQGGGRNKNNDNNETNNRRCVLNHEMNKRGCNDTNMNRRCVIL
jgi:hypothetical protein